MYGSFRLRLAVASLLFAAAETYAQPLQGFAGGDEFVGPFASWANVRTYGAQGDGVADDTSAIQNAFNDLGNPGRPLVLYLPAGTYRITRTLSLSLRRNISILGEHPAATTIRWDGPSDGQMLLLDSVSFSRFGRITWDGAGKALAAIDQSWTGSGVYGGSSYNEHADEIFRDAGFGIRGGSGGLQDGETAILRCSFHRMSKAAISIENYNALDWYIWDSTFDSNNLGVTNNYGAGNFQIYGSFFRNSAVSDVAINATSYFALRNNYSIGSRAFFVTTPIGNPAASVTFQRNTILDAQTTPIQFGNPGPVLMLDNVIRSASGQNGPVVKIAEAYTTLPTARLVAIGNTYSAQSPYAVQGTLLNMNDNIVDRATLNPPAPIMPVALQSYGRPVFDVPVGADANTIQAAIEKAAALNGQRPIVHLGPAAYIVTQTLTIPANVDLQLVGDSSSPVGGTQLHWAGRDTDPVLHIIGPSRAILRDFAVIGNGSSVGIQADNVDQPGSRILAQQLLAEHGRQSGVFVNGLENADVSFDNVFLAENNLGLRVAGGPNAARGPVPGRVGVFAGFSGENNLTYDVGSHGQLNAQDIWYEGAPPNFIRLTDSGSFTFDGGLISTQDPNHGGAASQTPTVTISGFQGNVTIINAFLLHSRISVESTAANVLALGIVGPPDNSNFFTVSNSPNAQVALLNSRQLTATGGSSIVQDQLSNVGDLGGFILQMAASLRSIQPHPFSDVPAGATDLRLNRITVDNHAVGATFLPGAVTEMLNPPAIPAPGVTSSTPFVTSQALNAPLRNQYSGWVGMQFRVGAAPLTVTSLGRICVAGNSGQHVMKLVASDADVSGGSATVSMSGCTPGQYAYASLPSPITLSAGATYLLMSQEIANGDFWYDFGNVSSTSAGSITGFTYWDGKSYVTTAFPSDSFGPLNFLYGSGSATPTPPVVAPPVLPPPLSGAAFVTSHDLSSRIRNDYTGWVGMRLTVGDVALAVNALGRMCVAGNSGVHTVKLVLASTHTDVPGGSAAVAMDGCTPGRYAYASLPLTVTLTAGTAYLLVSQEAANGDRWYDFGNVTSTAAAEIDGCIYWDGSAYVNVALRDNSYGPLNFLYQAGSTTTTRPQPPRHAWWRRMLRPRLSGTTAAIRPAPGRSGSIVGVHPYAGVQR